MTLEVQTVQTTADTVSHLPPVDGVIVRRAFAWIIDACLLAVIGVTLALALIVVGFLTFGLGWFLLPIVAVATIMAYAAISIGGSRQATPGMRMLDLIVTMPDGAPPPALNAAVHALLFYLMAPTFVLWFGSVLIGVLRSDARMGHDLLTALRVGRVTRSGLS